MQVSGMTTVHPDTKRINSSPNTVLFPIVQLLHGCGHTLKIPGSHTMCIPCVNVL